MDPDANLIEQRNIARDLIARFDRGENLSDYDAARLAELVIALDEWIIGRGFLPASWQKAQATA
jgi:hypothetical protein